MRMSTKGRYGLRALLYLDTEREADRPVSLSYIAQQEALSEKYLERMFSGFVRAGIVESVRGAGGGYFLRKSPSRITLLDIVEAIEGPVRLVECGKSPHCRGIDRCTAAKIWDTVSRNIENEFRRYTLAELKQRDLWESKKSQKS